MKERKVVMYESKAEPFDINAWLRLMCELIYQCDSDAAVEEDAAA